MRAVAALGLATILSGCVQTSSNPAAQPQEKWRVGCNINERDAYGKRVSPDYCWVMAGGYWENHPSAFTMIGETLIMVDGNGHRLAPARKISSLCNEVPRRIAVDGVRIDQLPQARQIEVALSGQVLTREQSRPWPYCNLVNYATNLDGLAAALDAAVAMWRERRPQS